MTCIPQSLCSWDFRVLGASAGSAALTFNFFTEQGGISLGHTGFTVRKHGPLSGHWSLEHNGQIVADARKPSAMFRSFDLRFADVHLTVTADERRTWEDLEEGGLASALKRFFRPFAMRERFSAHQIRYLLSKDRDESVLLDLRFDERDLLRQALGLDE